LSRIGATSTDWAGAAVAEDDPPAGAADPEAGLDPEPPLAGAASTLVPKIALMIFPKMLMVSSR
jgi:hypothetical protein